MSGKCRHCIELDEKRLYCEKTKRSVVPDPEFCPYYSHKKGDSLEKLNKIFTEEILRHCRGKHVLLTLTGGLDTRAILSVFSRHNIQVDCVTYWRSQDASQRKDHDIAITRCLARDVPCINKHHIIREKWVGHCVNSTSFRDLSQKYDVVVMGMMMSETFCKYENFHHSERNAIETYELKVEDSCDERLNAWIPPNAFLPSMNPLVQDALLDIPMMYRGFSAAQRRIILLNEPRLMMYPYTSFSFRFFLFRALYWRFIGLVERLT